jgi:hypothetical protein
MPSRISRENRRRASRAGREGREGKWGNESRRTQPNMGENLFKWRGELSAAARYNLYTISLFSKTLRYLLYSSALAAVDCQAIYMARNCPS